MMRPRCPFVAHYHQHIPFVPNEPFLYPPKTSENFYDFQGVEKGCNGNDWVIVESGEGHVTYVIMIHCARKSMCDSSLSTHFAKGKTRSKICDLKL